MKIKLYLTGLIMLLGMNLSQAKNIEPMVQDGRQWATRVWWAVSPPQLYTEIYRMEGDTVLDKKTYKKIYCYYTEDLSSGMLYHYAMRQEGDKVYLKFYGEKGETLFFDFSLTPGQTFSVNGDNMVVEVIGDTILSPDSKTRKCVFLKSIKYDIFEDIWVEGIGSLVYGINWDGLMEGLLRLDGAKVFNILCCHQNNKQIYQNPEYNNCFVGEAPPDVSTEKTPLNPAAFWRLSPQPAAGSVRVVCEASADGAWREGHWRLVDAAGKAVQGGVFADGSFEISLSDRPASLYFVDITAADGTTCRLKCLKATR